MLSGKEKGSDEDIKKKASRKGKTGKEQEKENLWEYCSKLPTLMEPDKMCKAETVKLNCITDFSVRPVNHMSESDRNNEIYKMFGAIVSQDINFMKQWLRVFSGMHKQYVKDLAKPYFKYKDTNYAKGIVGIKSGKRADILSIFLLSKITKTHTFIRLNE